MLHAQESILSPIRIQHVPQKNADSICKPSGRPQYRDTFYMSFKGFALLHNAFFTELIGFIGNQRLNKERNF